MIIEFWSVLKIEPTKDKNIIKNAYADMLKIYHPEEHPDEFLRVQKAYNDAMNYAKSEEYKQKRIPSKKTMESEMETEKETEQETEQKTEKETEKETKQETELRDTSIPVRVIRVDQIKNHKQKNEYIQKDVNTQENARENIPDYICDISKKNQYQQVSTYELMCYYIGYIMKRMKEKRIEGVDKEIESLFNILEFRQLAILPEFMNGLMEELRRRSAGNILVVRVLRCNYMLLAWDNPHNKFLAQYVEFLRRKEISLKENAILNKIIFLMLIIVSIILILFFIWYYLN